MTDATELPGSGRVDIWLLPLGDLTDAHRAAHETVLSDEERARAERFRVRHARDQFAAARALLRTVLQRYTGVASADWRWRTNAYGRPYVAWPETFSALAFNVSHTYGLVTCAVSAGHELGVDVEDTLRPVEIARLAPSVFAPSEVATLDGLAEPALRERFFAFWTLKESYIKARGMGLSLPLDSFWFDLGGACPRLSCAERCGDDPSRWRFFRWQPTPQHALALAVEAPAAADLDIRLRWMSPDLG